MGTRGLTAVQIDGKYPIAQYGQWDHYPSAQGVTALAFCHEHLKTEEGRAAFKAKIASAVRFSQDEAALNASSFERERDDYSAVAQAAMAGQPVPRAEVPKKKEQYPYAGRDNGAEILNLVWDAPPGKKVLLTDQLKFAGDSLFCEYAYVIDLDKNTLEVFKGFQTEPIGENERFASFRVQPEHRDDRQYWPVGLLRTYSLDNLPEKAAFLEDLTETGGLLQEEDPEPPSGPPTAWTHILKDDPS